VQPVIVSPRVLWAASVLFEIDKCTVATLFALSLDLLLVLQYSRVKGPKL